MHTSLKARYTKPIYADALDTFALETRDLSHIELVRSDNIEPEGSESIPNSYSVNISTKNKNKNISDIIPLEQAVDNECVIQYVIKRGERIVPELSRVLNVIVRMQL